MQTCRHWIFAALALSAIACATKTPAAGVAVCPPAAAELDVTPKVSSAEADPPQDATSAAVVSPRPPVQGAPVLQLVRMPAPDTVLLHFNEPVALSADIEPNQFRLSLATREREEDGYTALYYYDPQGEDDPLLATRVAGVVADDAHTIRLLLARPMEREFCDEFNAMVLESSEEPDMQGGLFLHYRDEGAAGIADTDGNRLEDIAKGWTEREVISTAHAGVNLAPIEAWGPIGCSFM